MLFRSTQAVLLADPTTIVLTAEPILSSAKMKNPSITSYAVNELYKKASGFEGYAQAALFVKAETAESHPEEVKDFLAKAEESCKKCTTDVASLAKTVAALQIMPNAKIAESAIPNCAIRFVSAAEAKPQVEATANLDLKQYGGALPAPDFYYEAK